MLVFTPMSSALSPGDATIHITSTVRKTTHKRGVVINSSSLYNRRITPRSIGNSVRVCRNVSDGVTLPKGRFVCVVVYRFPLGQITAMGVISSPVYYRLAVVGGTGIYSNILGQVKAQAYNLSPTRERLFFSLKAV